MKKNRLQVKCRGNFMPRSHDSCFIIIFINIRFCVLYSLLLTSGLLSIIILLSFDDLFCIFHILNISLKKKKTHIKKVENMTKYDVILMPQTCATSFQFFFYKLKLKIDHQPFTLFKHIIFIGISV